MKGSSWVSVVLLISAIVCLTSTAPVYAAPDLVNYQGRLSDVNGDALNGNHDLVFNLYDVPSGGAPLWTETHLGTDCTDGLFSVILGGATPFPQDLFQTDNLFLGITVDGGAELTNRQQLLSVPYSQRVETVDGSSGGQITSDVKISGTLNSGSSNLVSGTASAAIGFQQACTGSYSSVTGGSADTVSADGSHIGGGASNNVRGLYDVIGGGYGNSTDEQNSTVGGGFYNSATGLSSVVAGGSANEAVGIVSAVLGGSGNKSLETGSAVVGGANHVNNGVYSTIMGGSNCSILPFLGTTSYCMVFGSNVNLINQNMVVALFEGTSSGRVAINRDSDAGVFSYPFQVGTTSGNGNGAYLTNGGVWTNASSKEFKENYTPLDQQQLFDAIESLNIEGWNYRNSDEYHIGPYAEEFIRAFDVGAIDENTGKRVNSHLAASDVAGVALAAVKELIEKNRALELRIEQLEKKINQNTLAHR